MPKGDNKCVINLTTELKLFMDAHKGDLERSFHACLAYLQVYRDEFIQKYGQECYDEHVKRYSRPATQLRDESRERKAKAKESLERKLRIMELNAQKYAEQTEVVKEKLEIDLKAEAQKELVNFRFENGDALREIENLKPRIKSYEELLPKQLNAEIRERMTKSYEEAKARLKELVEGLNAKAKLQGIELEVTQT